MPTSTTVALLDAANNVLFVDHHFFEQLPASERDDVLKTSRPTIEVH